MIFMLTHLLNDMHSLYYQGLRSFFAQDWIINGNTKYLDHLFAYLIALLKFVDVGRTVKDVCREAGISEAS